MKTIRSSEQAKTIMISALTEQDKPVQFDINLDLRNRKYTITGYEAYGEEYLMFPSPNDDIAQFIVDLHEHAKMLLEEALRFKRKRIEILAQWKDLPRENPLPFTEKKSVLSKIIKKCLRR